MCRWIAAIFSILISTALGQSGPIRRISFHDDRQSEITSLRFSPDGSRLAAAFFVSAMNEPGTDWFAGVAQWDLKQHTRTLIHSACAPIAFADNDTLAMRHY